MTSDTVGDSYGGTRDLDRLDLPDRALFWRWVWSALRPVLGWVLVGAGAVALFLGWYGVSGQALTAKQLPYLVSGGLSGIGLLIIAGVFLATDDVRRQLRRLDAVERKVDELFALFTAVDPEAGTSRTDHFLALPGGTSYHREDCSLVAGKTAAQAVSAAQAHARRLRPCRLCEPSGD
ncbi:MAG: hypothetical protein ACYCO3_01005 [Mycobacteriales bacterium]